MLITNINHEFFHENQIMTSEVTPMEGAETVGCHNEVYS
jgi:hypothetical protein